MTGPPESEAEAAGYPALSLAESRAILRQHLSEQEKGPGNCILTSHATSAELEELKKASSPFPKSCDVAKQVVVWALNRSGRQESAAAVA